MPCQGGSFTFSVLQGQRLLRLAEMCRKLETEQEKVLPFYTSSLSAEELSLERADAMEPPSEELAQVQYVFPLPLIVAALNGFNDTIWLQHISVTITV